MNIFTNDDYRRIQAWLKANSVKDSELPHFTSENGSEKIAILQDGKNVLITLNELKQLIGGIVRVLTPPTIINVDNNVVIDAKIGTIYYTVGTDHYPYLDSEGNPVDNNTKEYDKPFSITENVTVRAIAKYTNSEGELLTSEITEKLVYFQKPLEEIEIPTPEDNLTYTGKDQIAFNNLDTSDDSPYTISGVIKATNVGDYEATFKLKNTAETKWKGKKEGIDEVEVLWSINKKKCEIKWSNPSGNFGEKEVGNIINFSATVDNGEITYYKNGTEEIASPYTLKPEDIGTFIKVVARHTLNDVDNYIVADDVTKTITVKEQSIPWQYACINENDLDSIVGPLVEEFGDDAINKVSIDSLNGISFTQYSPNDKGIQEIQIESSSPILILTFPKNTEYELVALSTAETSLAEFLLGHNYSEDVYVAIYAIDGGGKVKLSKKEI